LSTNLNIGLINRLSFAAVKSTQSTWGLPSEVVLVPNCRRIFVLSRHKKSGPRWWLR